MNHFCGILIIYGLVTLLGGIGYGIAAAFWPGSEVYVPLAAYPIAILATAWVVWKNRSKA